jgi:hypothetical protein
MNSIHYTFFPTAKVELKWYALLQYLLKCNLLGFHHRIPSFSEKIYQFTEHLMLLIREILVVRLRVCTTYGDHG